MKAKFPSYQDRTKIPAIYKSLPKSQKKILNDYVSYLSTTAGKSKVGDYRRYMLQIYDVMEKDFDKFKPQDIINFSALLNLDDTREINTKNIIKVTLKRFIKYFYEKDIDMISEKILSKLNQKFILVNEERFNKGTYINDEELERLLRTAESMSLKAQLILLYESGCRPHEVRCAKWKAIDWDRKLINVYASKTSKARSLPLNEAIIHLKRWRQEFIFPNVSDNDYIFPSRSDRNKPIGAFGFTYRIRVLGKKAKINRPVFPYLIRHTRLNELYNKYKVQGLEHKKFAGHSPKSDMTGVYVSTDDEDMIKSVISQVYHVEELTPEENDKLKKVEKEMEEIKILLPTIQALSDILKDNPKLQKYINHKLKMKNKEF